MLADRVRIGSYSGGCDDTSGSPGECKLIAGDMEAGYFGEISMQELITGDALADLIGLSAGISQFSDSAGWLKFAYKGKIQFVAKKPLRYNATWERINSANAVYGEKVVQIGNLTYKVRLMKTGLTDSMSSSSGAVLHCSEWNRWMLPIHVRAKDKSWNYPNNVEAGVPYWGIDFTDEDLLTHYNYGRGSHSWCQETINTNNTYRALRGFEGISCSNTYPASTTGYGFGWRPVLELIE